MKSKQTKKQTDALPLKSNKTVEGLENRTLTLSVKIIFNHFSTTS